MKFYDKYKGWKRRPNYLSVLLAILIATGMWYFVRVGEIMETQLDINLDYSGIPPNLVVTSGLANSLNVRLRGPAVLIRSIPQEMRNHIINLSMIKKGKTAVPTGGEELTAVYRAFEVIDIQPPVINVEADTLIERSVPVDAVFDSPLGKNAMPVENLTIKPSTVTIRGPESIISSITAIPLNIHLDPKAADMIVDETKILYTPSLVTANPPSVRVGFRIASSREVIMRLCKITIAGQNRDNYKVNPPELTLLVEVPKIMAADESYLKKIRLIADIPELEPGASQAVKIRPELPEGMILAHPINEDVIISRGK